jgi:hypothetical protein
MPGPDGVSGGEDLQSGQFASAATRRMLVDNLRIKSGRIPSPDEAATGEVSGRSL